MSQVVPIEIRVSVDVGSHQHSVAIGLSTGECLEEFEISHQPEGFKEFFTRIEKYEREYGLPVAVVMEGYNGYARPLDTMVRVGTTSCITSIISNWRVSRRSFRERQRTIGSMPARDWSCFS